MRKQTSKAAQAVGYVKARAAEPSTWAAVSGALAALAPIFPAYGAALAAGSVIAGAVGAVRGDGGGVR